ncbi:hypothetical protein, partial [Salmonella enterica]|uniref:hypothetical protein n=1 Tax=Salmonella enterica TaxID=28901 RepID=UPI003296D150
TNSIENLSGKLAETYISKNKSQNTKTISMMSQVKEKDGNNEVEEINDFYNMLHNMKNEINEIDFSKTNKAKV